MNREPDSLTPDMLQSFLAKAAADYEAFCQKTEEWDAPGIMEHADEIYAMKEIYAALTAPEDHFSPEEIARLSQSPHPLESVYGYWESLT